MASPDDGEHLEGDRAVRLELCQARVEKAESDRELVALLTIQCTDNGQQRQIDQERVQLEREKMRMEREERMEERRIGRADKERQYKLEEERFLLEHERLALEREEKKGRRLRMGSSWPS